jgi:hypothetical protein
VHLRDSRLSRTGFIILLAGVPMFERLGFTPGATASFEGSDHGINTLEEVVFLNDKDIDILVKHLRRPGGMISGTAIDGEAAQGNPGPWLLTLFTLFPSGLIPISSWQCSTCAIKHGF